MIVVTGAGGRLGRRVVRGLVERVGAGRVRAVARDGARARAVLPAGVTVVEADYDRPASLVPAFAGAERLLLVSSNDVRHARRQHRAAVDAACIVGVGHLVYTSLLNCPRSRAQVADVHGDTEAAIRASGLPWTLLRNGWYLENCTENLMPHLQMGAIYGAAGKGRVAGASRDDLAAAAVEVLLGGSGHVGRVYELGGDVSFDMEELAAIVSRVAQRCLPYVDVGRSTYRATLEGAGVSPHMANLIADADVAIAHGDLDTASIALHRLLGRPTIALVEKVREALAP